MTITAMDYLQLEIIDHVDKIESYLHEVGLDSINKFTVIARDPKNGEMFIILTNDNLSELISLLQKEQENG